MTKKINWTIIIIILIITAFLIGYGKNLVSLNKTDKNPICEGKALQNKEVTEILPLGEVQASVLLEVYSDYQCPFCGRYYVETIKPMIKDYVDVSKVKLLYKDIAFEGDKSQWAAEAVRCANDQGKFWAYHDKITTVRYQTNNTQIYNKTNLIKTAQELGLDECEFTLCLESGKYTELVKNDTQEAWNKINGTPTSFLNNKMVANDKGENLGAMSYEILKAEIEKVLSSKN